MKTHILTFFILAFTCMPLAQALAETTLPDIVRDKPLEQRFIAAAAELGELMADYRQRIQTAPAEALPALKVQMGQEAKYVLEKYNLSEADLARYRQEVEDATKAPLKDPEFRGIIQRLNE